MKTTLKEDSTDDYYGKLSLVNAGRGVLNAPDVDVCGCYLSIALFQLIHIVDLITIIYYYYCCLGACIACAAFGRLCRSKLSRHATNLRR